jgi:hypothetical protein
VASSICAIDISHEKLAWPIMGAESTEGEAGPPDSMAEEEPPLISVCQLRGS